MSFKSRYSYVIWLIALFTLYGITRMTAGLYVSDEGALASLSFNEQKDILANDLLLVIASKYLIPVLVSIYAFAVSVTVILHKRYPPLVLPVPKLPNGQSGGRAVRFGLILLCLSLFALCIEALLIRRDVLVYLELFK